MQTYVINLARATERMDHMSAMLQGLGIPFERFDALDPERARLHPVFPQIRPLSAKRNWVPGEIACLLSHYEVWHLIAKSPAPYGLVLEDDVLLHPTLAKIQDGSWPLPKDADLVKVETDAHSIVALSRRQFRAAQGWVFRRLLSMHGGTGAYIMSREAATFLVTSQTAAHSFDMPVDDMLFIPTHPIGRRLRVYQAVPALAIQSNNLPDVEQKPDLGSALEVLRSAERTASPTGSADASGRTRLRNFPRRIYLRVVALRTVVPFGSASCD